jgi:outer membrane receptor protein involved in Fe transport
VLRGPQGNLFGRNTIGGLIHIIRAKPTGELGGKVSLTMAEDNQRDIKAALNLPSVFNDTLATKITAVKTDGGGYFDNETRGKREGDSDYGSVSLSGLWTPTEDISLHLIYDHIDDKTPVRPVTGLSESGELLYDFGLFGDEQGYRAYKNQIDQVYSQYFGRLALPAEINGFITTGKTVGQVATHIKYTAKLVRSLCRWLP